MEDQSIGFWEAIEWLIICAAVFMFMLCVAEYGVRRGAARDCARLGRRHQVETSFGKYCVVRTVDGDVPAEHWIPPDP